MSWGFFQPYVSVAERQRQAEQAAKKLLAKGQTLDPIKIAGRAIVTTFWGKAWCANLEHYSDFHNRLPRGRSYARNGSILDLQIHSGIVSALVAGSSLYKIKIEINPLAPARWQTLKSAAAGKVTNLLDLLQGRLSKDILAEITHADTGLFPKPSEIKLNCSCPDWADMCKHVAAVLYGIGARLDAKPELFFTLRGVDMQELISAASAQAIAPLDGAAKSKKRTLAQADLADIFGVELETPDEPVASVAHVAPVAQTKVAKSKSKATPEAQTGAKRFSVAKKRALLSAWRAEVRQIHPRSKSAFCRDHQLSTITLDKWLADAPEQHSKSATKQIVAVSDAVDGPMKDVLDQIRAHQTQIDALQARLDKLTGSPR